MTDCVNMLKIYFHFLKLILKFLGPFRDGKKYLYKNFCELDIVSALSPTRQTKQEDKAQKKSWQETLDRSGLQMLHS